MKNSIKLFGFIFLTLVICLSMISCGGNDGSNNTPGGGSSLEGNGVVWEAYWTIGSGLIFRDGIVYLAVKNGNNWFGSSTWRYTATHIIMGPQAQTPYLVSGNTLTIEGNNEVYTRRTGQTIQILN